MQRHARKYRLPARAVGMAFSDRAHSGQLFLHAGNIVMIGDEGKVASVEPDAS
jgi:hypothetical protein